MCAGKAYTRNTFLQSHVIDYKIIVPILQHQQGMQWHFDNTNHLILNLYCLLREAKKISSGRKTGKKKKTAQQK